MNLTQQSWLIQPLFTGVFFALGIIFFFQLLVRRWIRFSAEEEESFDFSSGRLFLISVLYFSVFAVILEYSAAQVHHDAAFLNFRLLLLFFVIIFLGLRPSLVIMLAGDVAHLTFFGWQRATWYYVVLMAVLYLLIWAAIYLVQRYQLSSLLTMLASDVLAIGVWVALYFVQLQGMGQLTVHDLVFNLISFVVMALILFYGLISLHQDNVQLNVITHRATVDSLTKLKNYYMFTKEYQQAFNQARENGTLLTVLELDVDHFKRINDDYGHLAGNKVLRQVGATLQRFTSEIDQAECYHAGGEEFNVLLPGVSLATAQEFAEEMQKTIAQLVIHYEQQTITLTVSIGIATLRDFDETTTHLFERADRMLYLSKGHGRNLVTTDENH